jgi:hypothetical protein
MNCPHIEELLPLYISGDVEPTRTNLIATHLQSCAACAESLREYAGAHQLLADFDPPTFDESLYNGIRSDVLREIRRDSVSREPLSWLGQLFQPRAAWVFATALLLAVLLASVYILVNRSGHPLPAQQAGFYPGNDPRGKEPGVQPQGTNGTYSPPRKKTGVAVNQQFRPRRRIVISPAHSEIAVKTTLSPAQPVIDLADKTGGSSSPDASPDAGPEKTLRLDMQTSDPNIRIIWFSNQHARTGSPMESSKGI